MAVSPSRPAFRGSDERSNSQKSAAGGGLEPRAVRRLADEYGEAPPFDGCEHGARLDAAGRLLCLHTLEGMHGWIFIFAYVRRCAGSLSPPVFGKPVSEQPVYQL